MEKSNFTTRKKARSNNDSCRIEPEIPRNLDAFQREYELTYMDYQESVYLLITAKKSLQIMQDDIKKQFLGMDGLLEKSRKDNAEIHYAVGCMKMLQKLEETTPKLEAILNPLREEFGPIESKLVGLEDACSAASHIMPKQLQESLANLECSHTPHIQDSLEEINRTVCTERLCDLEVTAKALQDVTGYLTKQMEDTTRSKRLLTEADELFEEEESLIFDVI